MGLDDAILAAAARQGLVTPAVSPPGPPPASTPVGSLASILAGLEEDRAER